MKAKQLQTTEQNKIHLIQVKRERLDNGWAKEALEVATAGELKSRDEFLGNRRSAYDVAALEDCDRETRAGEVGRGGEAVVTAADDDRVPFLLP